MRSGDRNSKPFDIDVPIPVGGVNTSLSVSDIADNELSAGHNTWINKYGQFETRPGFEKVTDSGTGEEITGGFYSSVESENLVASDGHLYSLNVTTGALTDEGALSSTSSVDMCDYNDGVAVASGGVLQQYKEGTLSSISPDDTALPTDTKYVEAYMRRLWACGDQSISWTGAESWTDWGGAGLTGGQLYVEKNDGSSITGLSLLDGEPIIFKGGPNERQSIHHLTGSVPDDFAVLPISSGTSCLAGHCIANVQGDIVFPGVGGVYTLSMIRDFDNPRSFPLSLKVDSLYTAYTPLWSAFDAKRGLYYLLTSGYLFVWHTGTKAWNVWDINAFTPKVAWMGDSDNLYIGADDGHVYKFNDSIYTDAGESYTWDFTTKSFKFSAGNVDKLFKWLYLDYVPLGDGGVTVNYRSNYGQTEEHSKSISLTSTDLVGWDGSFCWDTAGIGWDMSNYISRRQRMNFRSGNIQIQVASTAPFRLVSWGVAGAVLGRSRRTWN